MAKCVKEKQSGRISRVSDDMASAVVATGKYGYVPKSEYRAFVKDSQPYDGSYTGDERLGTPDFRKQPKGSTHA